MARGWEAAGSSSLTSAPRGRNFTNVTNSNGGGRTMPLFGKRSTPEELPETLRQLLAEVKTDRAELETLLARVNEAGARVPGLDEPLRVAVGRATEIASRLAGPERRRATARGALAQGGRAAAPAGGG